MKSFVFIMMFILFLMSINNSVAQEDLADMTPLFWHKQLQIHPELLVVMEYEKDTSWSKSVQSLSYEKAMSSQYRWRFTLDRLDAQGHWGSVQTNSFELLGRRELLWGGYAGQIGVDEKRKIKGEVASWYNAEKYFVSGHLQYQNWNQEGAGWILDTVSSYKTEVYSQYKVLDNLFANVSSALQYFSKSNLVLPKRYFAFNGGVQVVVIGSEEGLGADVFHDADALSTLYLTRGLVLEAMWNMEQTPQATQQLQTLRGNLSILLGQSFLIKTLVYHSQDWYHSKNTAQTGWQLDGALLWGNRWLISGGAGQIFSRNVQSSLQKATNRKTMHLQMNWKL